MTDDRKACVKCAKKLPVERFYRAKETRDGLRGE